MKRLMIVIMFFLLASTGVLVGMSAKENKSIYKLYDEQESVTYDEILDSETPTIYYYYQDSCHFCNSIKDQMTEYAQKINATDNLDFKLIDLEASKNANAWYDWATHNKIYGEDTPATDNPDYIYKPEDMHSVEDVKITGTPGLVYVEDGDIKEYAVGLDIFDVLDKIDKEYNIDMTFDRSKYGKS